MDLRQLAALVAVADHHSFSAAAEALHTVQSNVSNHVAHLEKELGVQLVDRHAGELTEEGQAVVERARRVTAELDALVADVAAVRDEVVGTVRLGMIGTTARWLAPRLLERLAEEHPKVRLMIADATSTTLEPLLAAGLMDLGVVTLPVPAPDLVGRALFDEDLVLVVQTTHPLASRPWIDITELEGMDLLLPAPGTAFRGDLDQAAAAAGVNLIPKAELDGLRLIASLTFDGYGPAVLPATAIPPRLEGMYLRIPVHGLPYRRVGVATRRRGRPSAPARAVIAVMDRIIATDVDSRSGLHLPAA